MYMYNVYPPTVENSECLIEGGIKYQKVIKVRSQAQQTFLAAVLILNWEKNGLS